MNNFLFAAPESPIEGLTFILFLALALVVILIAIATIVSGILKIKIFFSYWVTNREATSGGYTGATAARKLLSDLGYDDVKVERIGFFSMLIYGNHYNPVRKTIYLRKSVYDKKHLTAVGLALQKVGLAIQDKRDNTYKRRWKIQKIALFAPIFFIPIVIVGLILDIIMLGSGNMFGLFTMITSILGIAYFIVGFVLSIFIIKTEGKANKETLKIMAESESDFLNPYEQEKVAKVFKTYQLSYICDFIISILEIIKFILKLILTILSKKNKDN